MIRCKPVEQIRIGNISERIFARARHRADVEIVVRQIQMSFALLLFYKAFILLACGVEALHEKRFSVWRGRFEGECAEWASLGNDSDDEREQACAEARLLILRAPIVTVAGARKVIQKLPARFARLVFLNV